MTEGEGNRAQNQVQSLEIKDSLHLPDGTEDSEKDAQRELNQTLLRFLMTLPESDVPESQELVNVVAGPDPSVSSPAEGEVDRAVTSGAERGGRGVTRRRSTLKKTARFEVGQGEGVKETTPERELERDAIGKLRVEAEKGEGNVIWPASREELHDILYKSGTPEPGLERETESDSGSEDESKVLESAEALIQHLFDDELGSEDNAANQEIAEAVKQLAGERNWQLGNQ